MYLVSETLQRMDNAGAPQFWEEDKAVLKSYKQYLDHATKFIPGVGQGFGGPRPWGLQMEHSTEPADDWALTLPMSIALSGELYWLSLHLF